MLSIHEGLELVNFVFQMCIRSELQQDDHRVRPKDLSAVMVINIEMLIS